MLTLTSNGYELSLDPEHGGVVTALSFLGLPILRGAKGLNLVGPKSSACFPLVPFSNRIHQARFSYARAVYQLGQNDAGDPHALHGDGWQSRWRVGTQTDQSCEMWYDGGANWPWHYLASQKIDIRADGVWFRLAIENTSASPFPAGLGFHPYFPRVCDTQVQFDAKGTLRPGLFQTRQLDALAPDQQFHVARTLRDTDLDHCYFGWARRAIITQPRTGLAIELSTPSPTEWCTVYAPPRADFFCIEPVSHATGAFNRLDQADEGVKILAPGDTFEFEMRLSAAAVQ
ncbi:MAG: aldose 1-epimerase [Pseudomonadota bacterium]